MISLDCRCVPVQRPCKAQCQLAQPWPADQLCRYAPLSLQVAAKKLGLNATAMVMLQIVGGAAGQVGLLG